MTFELNFEFVPEKRNIFYSKTDPENVELASNAVNFKYKNEKLIINVFKFYISVQNFGTNPIKRFFDCLKLIDSGNSMHNFLLSIDKNNFLQSKTKIKSEKK